MESHLLQMRGLKHKDNQNLTDIKKSHLLQMRGLKPRKTVTAGAALRVASFTDAWIETGLKESRRSR